LNCPVMPTILNFRTLAKTKQWSTNEHHYNFISNISLVSGDMFIYYLPHEHMLKLWYCHDTISVVILINQLLLPKLSGFPIFWHWAYSMKVFKISTLFTIACDSRQHNATLTVIKNTYFANGLPIILHAEF
jgi:hypothetical protein